MVDNNYEMNLVEDLDEVKTDELNLVQCTSRYFLSNILYHFNKSVCYLASFFAFRYFVFKRQRNISKSEPVLNAKNELELSKNFQWQVA